MKLFNASGMQLSVGDVVRYGGRPHYIYSIGNELVFITSMCERKFMFGVTPSSIGCVLEKGESHACT
jgi:hypothetical protein